MKNIYISKENIEKEMFELGRVKNGKTIELMKLNFNSLKKELKIKKRFVKNKSIKSKKYILVINTFNPLNPKIKNV